MNRMAAQGWVCVAINYRLAPRDPWPAHVVDVKRAIAWVREHIAEHGGDPTTSSSPAGPRAATSPRSPRSRPAIPRSSPASRTPTPACRRPCRSTASTTSPARPASRTRSACATRSWGRGSCRPRGPTPPTSTRRRPRSCGSPRTHPTSSSSTASSTASSRSTRRASSSPSCAGRRGGRSSTPSSRRPARLRGLPLDPQRARRPGGRPLPVVALEHLAPRTGGRQRRRARGAGRLGLSPRPRRH